MKNPNFWAFLDFFPKVCNFFSTEATDLFNMPFYRSYQCLTKYCGQKIIFAKENLLNKVFIILQFQPSVHVVPL